MAIPEDCDERDVEYLRWRMEELVQVNAAINRRMQPVNERLRSFRDQMLVAGIRHEASMLVEDRRVGNSFILAWRRSPATKEWDLCYQAASTALPTGAQAEEWSGRFHPLSDAPRVIRIAAAMALGALRDVLGNRLQQVHDMVVALTTEGT